MPDLTFIIPIGPDHVGLADRAVESVRAQTVPCRTLTLMDRDGEGPGALRNRMLQAVQSPFVSFLDADDRVAPTFAEETLQAYWTIGADHYIFTDWVDGEGRVFETPCLNGPNGSVVSAPDRKPYCGGTWHPLTTLIPTEWARAVGGFDASLPAAEDTDFYLKLCTTLRCGHRLARPLFYYQAGGGRSARFHRGNQYSATMGELTRRYGGKMGCCGDKQTIVRPIGEKQAGDVLAMAMWHGNRTEFGRVTKRNYPRISYPRTAWVDPRDVSFSPQLWQVVEQSSDLPVGPVDHAQPMGLREMASAAMNAVVRSPYAPTVPEPPTPPVQATPDVNRVIRLGRRSSSNLKEPLFVFPEKDYPSYADFRRLVALSGFQSIRMPALDVFSRQPLIVVSPEPLPNLKGIPARVICWQLEYAGDYAHNYAGFEGEVWASDKGWAEQHGARYVLLGSHPDLVGEWLNLRKMDWDYDVTLLGYMTPRRQAIKNALSDLRWPVDYPGHDTQARADVLWSTRLMLNIHQHDHAPYIAPQRIALAAAFHLPVLSETVADPGPLADCVGFGTYEHFTDKLGDYVRRALERDLKIPADKLHEYLCVEHPFRSCVEAALEG